ncbi:hypothetical protein DM01DRAFT_1347846 [Hesseltinella vesiculosa]|uniref:Uncharacterized protein n=1 Tax=Hesseltinella vesiculosa TaxID=101127 RepID=A0A1X2GC82_9FUNG|nr:hypothetical protein DM01DRAFT_1347846 [Hesseltinella vesiculosa]
MEFVRKSMLIVLGQLLGTLVLTCGLEQIQLTWHWLQNSVLTWWIPLIPCVIACVLILWQLWAFYFQLVQLARIILLTVFSILCAFVVGETVVTFCYEDGIMVMAMVGSGFMGYYLYTLQVKHSFSGPGPWFLGMALICLTSLWLRMLFEQDPLEILIPLSIAGVVCTYVLLDLYYIMGNSSVDEVILANVCLFVDVLYPMRCLHNICELSDNLNLLDVLYPGEPSTRSYATQG